MFKLCEFSPVYWMDKAVFNLCEFSNILDTAVFRLCEFSIILDTAVFRLCEFSNMLDTAVFRLCEMFEFSNLLDTAVFRLCEMFEFSNLLDTAAGQTDPYKQLMYVAAFAVGQLVYSLFMSVIYLTVCQFISSPSCQFICQLDLEKISLNPPPL